MAVGARVRQDGAKRLEDRAGRAVFVLVEQEAVPVAAVAVGLDQRQHIARVVAGVVVGVRFHVEGDMDVVRLHHVHQRRDHLVDVAVGPPPADVNRADSCLRNPARVPFHHRGGSRIVQSERGHEVRSEVTRRIVPAFGPVLPRIGAIPGVILEQEMPPEIGVPLGERRSALSGERCRPTGQRARGGQGRRMQERAAGNARHAGHRITTDGHAIANWRSRSRCATLCI